MNPAEILPCPAASRFPARRSRVQRMGCGSLAGHPARSGGAFWLSVQQVQWLGCGRPASGRSGGADGHGGDRQEGQWKKCRKFTQITVDPHNELLGSVKFTREGVAGLIGQFFGSADIQLGVKHLDDHHEITGCRVIGARSVQRAGAGRAE